MSNSDYQKALDKLRGGNSESAELRLTRTREDMKLRAKPTDLTKGNPVAYWPWSREGKALQEARQLETELRLDLYKDDLAAVKAANQILNRAAVISVAETAQTAVFEIRTMGESIRYSILTSAQRRMTQDFLDHLERLESFRGRVSDEVLDAMKEGALHQFTDRMARIGDPASNNIFPTGGSHEDNGH